jgi:hypothetical protein
LLSENTVRRHAVRSVDFEIELHLALTCEESYQRNFKRTKETVFLLKNNLTFFLMAVDLLIK